MDIIGKRKWWFLISGMIILPGIISLSLWGLKLSIDFTGGTLMEVQGNTDKTEVEEIAKKNNLENISIISSGENRFTIRSKEINEETHGKLKEELQKSGLEEISFETIGSSVSKNIVRRVVIATILASLVIIFYVAWAFRSVPEPASSWRFGICAIFALIHDVLVVTGIFSILGHFLGIEIDSMFVTAMLTLIGFSVHDTIVIFDRIRENLRKGMPGTFEEVANKSIVEMLSRDLNTSLLVSLILFALYLFGGESTKYFILALVLGVITGTYSSIMDAAPLLVVWQNFSEKRMVKKRV